MDVDFWKQLEEYYKSLQLNQNDAVDLAQLTRSFLYSFLELDQINESNLLLIYNIDDLIQVILKFVDELQPHHYPTPFTYTYNLEPCHQANDNESQDDCYGNPSINEAAPFEKIKDERLFIPQPDNHGIFYRLNEFIFDYNQYRDIAHQIDGYAVTRCFRDNIMDYADFADLNNNLQRYGIPAGPVRKLWRFLNPVGTYIYIPSEHENEGILPGDNDDDEFIPREYENEGIEFEDNDEYVPSEYEDEGIVYQDNDDENDNEEYIDLEIGENLSVPSDWSDDE